MNAAVLDKKLKKRLAQLRQWRSESLLPAVFTGEIGGDDGEPRAPLKLREGAIWGGARRNFDLRAVLRFPRCGEESFVLSLRLGTTHLTDSLDFLYGPEAVVLIDGRPVSGCDPNHCEVFVPREYWDGNTHELRLDGWTGLADEPYQVGFLGVERLNEGVSRFCGAAELCYRTAMAVRDETLRARMLELLAAAFDQAPLAYPDTEASARAMADAEAFLRREIDSLPRETLCAVTACGHGHIDLAWLWRTCVTRKKAARTFLNVLRLMERHEHFFYSQTQAQLYRWLETDYPEILEEIKRRVKEGRWETLGGMRVEPDCNITGAESLVRQFLLYDRYMTGTFGDPGTPVVWLPDTFGFCGQLPQLMSQAGIRCFATAKLTWNQYNKMPSESFRWRGIDGTEILSHIVSVSKPDWFGGTYSAELSPEELLTTVEKAENRRASRNMLLAYGNGDGGGGPTENMLRNAELLAPGYPGLPSVATGTFRDFFEKLSREKDLPVWDGELYLELHRGTYTSQSETKRGNRLCETALNRAEFLRAWAKLSAALPYPRETLRRCWETLCLNQFHDILPGSSIHPVYEDTAQQHGEILETCEKLCEDAVRALEGRIAADASLLVLNSSPLAQDALIRLPFPAEAGERICTAEGEPLPQFELDGGRFIRCGEIAPYGYLALRRVRFPKNAAPAPAALSVAPGTPLVLENEYIRVCLDEQGEIQSWIDLESGRELVRPGGRMAQWRLYDDLPGDWDAWDIDEDYTARGFARARLLSVSLLTADGCMHRVCMKKEIGGSFIEQEITLLSGARELRFDCVVDYRETHKLLRVSNDAAIHASFAEYGTQFGSILRPTTANTSWEQARFECCMQGWVDLCEGDYGLGLACDNRYGVSVRDGCISLAVQKSAVFPDETADRGKHRLCFALIPHRAERKGDVIRTSYSLKRPLCACALRAPAGENWAESLVQSDAPTVLAETVKMAEEEDALLVRVYETGNTRGRTALRFGLPMAWAAESDLLEKSRAEIPLEGDLLAFSYRPYEIKTFMLKPKEKRDESHCDE